MNITQQKGIPDIKKITRTPMTLEKKSKNQIYKCDHLFMQNEMQLWTFAVFYKLQHEWITARRFVFISGEGT